LKSHSRNYGPNLASAANVRFANVTRWTGRIFSAAGLFSLMFPLIMGGMLWGGLCLRSPELRSLIPVRR
jgi:hypothetical protein